MDVALTPSEDLAVEVLAARARLGETVWTFEARHTPVLRRLGEKGLVNVISPIAQGTIRASLTDAGRELALSADYVAPALDPNCRSAYWGPRSPLRVDCDRKAGHQKKHRHRWPERTGLGTVRWTDAEAWGGTGEGTGADADASRRT